MFFGVTSFGCGLAMFYGHLKMQHEWSNSLMVDLLLLYTAMGLWNPHFFGSDGPDRTGPIISPPYPEVTLDNFGFPVGGRLGARRAVFRPRLPKVALFGSGRVFIASTPNFGPSLTKLVGTIRVTKKMTHNDNGAGPGRIYGETVVFTFCRKAENGPKIRFFPKKNPKFAKRLIFIWEKGTLFFWQLCPVVARTWLVTKSGGFFWAPKIRFSARNLFFCMGPRFLAKGRS